MSEPRAQAGQTAPITAPLHRFRSPKVMARVLVALLALCAGLTVYRMLPNRDPYGIELLLRGNWQIAPLDSVTFSGGLCALLTAIVFMFWCVRVTLNVRALEGGARFNPWLTVLYWFVPIVNLFRPYQVVKEAWRTSRLIPARSAAESTDHSPLLPLWWTFWLLAVVLARMAHRDPVILLFPPVVWIWACLYIGAALLAIMIVMSVSRGQLRRFQRLASPSPSSARPVDASPLDQMHCGVCNQSFVGGLSATGGCPLCGVTFA